jgi:NADH-quinone oxidoreductase subunit N
MYTKEADGDVKPVPTVYFAVAVIAILLNLAMGLCPTMVTGLLK